MSSTKRSGPTRPAARRKDSARAGPPEPAAFAPPYPPSWINRLADRVDRLPGPAWAYYLGAASLLTFLQLIIQWSAGTYAFPGVDWFNVLAATALPYLIGLMHYLIRTSGRSFEEFRPALRASPSEAEQLKFRLTTMPARPVRRAVIWVTLGSLVLFSVSFLADRSGAISSRLFLGGDFVQTAEIFRIAPTPASIGLTAVIVIASQTTTATYAYLMVHQLRLIGRIYADYTEIRFFQLAPLYAFSRHTLRSALGLLAFAYVLIATAPQVFLSPLGFGSWVLLVAGALATFFLPLLGIHRRLVREKARMLSEAGRRLEAGVAELHRRIDARRLGKMDDLNKALASVEIERAAYERVPTWPWERGTLRSLVAALVVPVLIWLVQFALQRMLAG